MALAEQCSMCSNTNVTKPVGTFMNIHLKFNLEEDFCGAGLHSLKRVPDSHVKLSKRTSDLLGPSEHQKNPRTTRLRAQPKYQVSFTSLIDGFVGL